MNKNEALVKEDSPGVAFAKAMLESQRQTEKYILELYNDPTSEFRKRIEKRKREAMNNTINQTQDVPV